MTGVGPVDEIEDTGSDILLVAGGGGGTPNEGAVDGPSAPSSTLPLVVIVNGMGIKIEVLNLESSSPSVPAEEDDRDRPKNSFRVLLHLVK
jgi:hypothetical protein